MNFLLKKFFILPILFLLLQLYWFNTDMELAMDNNFILVIEQTLTSFTFIYIAALLYFDESKIRSGHIFLVQTIILISWIALAFKNYLVFNGDNFHYILSGQSIFDNGIMLDTHKLGSPRSTIIPPLLPFIIAGVFSIFGENFTIVKMVISALLLLSSFAFFDLLKTYINNKKVIAIITIVAFSSPFLIHASTMIMTEIPFIFTSILALWTINKFNTLEKINTKWYIMATLVSLFCLLTYFSRFIGVCLVPAVILFFFRKISFKNNLKTILKSFEAKRFILIFTLLGLTFGGRLMYENTTSNSNKSTELLSEKSQKQFYKNLESQIAMIPSLVDQNIIFRKYSNFKYKLNVIKHNNGKVYIYLIFILGILILLFRNNIISYYLLFGTLILTIGSKVADPLAILRYMSVFIPFTLFLFYEAIKFLYQKITPIFLSKKNKHLILNPIFPIIILLSIYTNSSLGMGYLVKLEQEKTENKQPYHPSQANFFELAKWCRNKLPKDQYVMSRKPRMFSVYAQVPSCGIHAKKGNAKLNVQKEMQRLKDKKIKYIVIDTFSQLAHGLMVPLINANGKHFKIIKQFGEETPAYLFEIIY